MYYDLHTHSALSPCADDDMTPNNMVNMAAMSGLSVLGVTDHNACANVRAAIAVGKAAGVIVVPGMELTTAEEIHVLCLFPDADAAEAFARAVYDALAPIENRADIFGNQLVMDENDEVVAREPRLLLTATSVGVYDVPAMVEPYGGVAVLAHIDRHANGVLGILADIDPGMGYRLAEVSRNASAADYAARYPFLRFLSDSDAHTLADLAEPGADNVLPDGLSDAREIIAFLRKK